MMSSAQIEHFFRTDRFAEYVGIELIQGTVYRKRDSLDARLPAGEPA